ncbi:G/T mismatch-specific thymine DNA glycosylase [Octopus sinensis]|uniref:G/T mismatch-specific thymine DNA glycosylase n=1 Tax=Octopus sinensis TaxID=2607531 RepID=A0A7E6FT05_9MOLL|nr:G/T mismatch-specific thymine DNA glycosylase [Octopus sinensis]
MRWRGALPARFSLVEILQSARRTANRSFSLLELKKKSRTRNSSLKDLSYANATCWFLRTMNIGSPYYYPYQMGPAPVPPIYGAPLQAVKLEPDSNLGKMMKGKRKIKAEPIEENIEMSKPNMKKVKQEKITDHMPVKKKRDRFHGMSEEEVMLRTLPDHLQPNLDIVIVSCCCCCCSHLVF